MADSDRLSANRQARDARKQAYLRATFDRYSERLRAGAEGDALALARDTHAAVDALIGRDRGADPESAGIRCGRGCSHCCRNPVEIWPQEAALLVEAARAAGIGLDPARLERQARHGIDDWQRQPRADTACIFLGEDGACRVYEARPSACRKLLVTTDPALCDPAQHLPDAAGRWFSWEAELLEAAALETLGRNLMPRALLAAMGNGR
jgi:Fe-S-cluster containining protein